MSEDDVWMLPHHLSQYPFQIHTWGSHDNIDAVVWVVPGGTLHGAYLSGSQEGAAGGFTEEEAV